MPPRDQPTGDDERGRTSLGRLLAFSDGVFAIAIAILVLHLDVPDGLTNAALRGYLAEQTPRLLGAALGFVIIGRLWIAHRGLFGHIRTADEPLLILGTVLLAPIVLIPVVTKLLAEYADTGLAGIAYSVTVWRCPWRKAPSWPVGPVDVGWAVRGLPPSVETCSRPPARQPRSSSPSRSR